MTEPADPASATAASHLARNLVSLRHTRALTQDSWRAMPACRARRSPTSNPAKATRRSPVLVKVAGALGVPIDELLASPRAMVRRWPAARWRGAPRDAA